MSVEDASPDTAISSTERYEQLTGIDPTDFFHKTSMRTIEFTDDWMYAELSNKATRISIPKPLFLLTRFHVGERYGVAYGSGNGFAYIVKRTADEAERNITFNRQPDDRLKAHFNAKFDADTIHMTYDPDADTLVIYPAQGSPFPVRE